MPLLNVLMPLIDWEDDVFTASDIPYPESVVGLLVTPENGTELAVVAEEAELAVFALPEILIAQVPEAPAPVLVG
jgi:hypothetical protein